MNLGDCSVNVVSDSLATACKIFSDERHWHSFGYNMKYYETLTEAGLRPCIYDANNEIVSGVTLADHPFFLAV